MSDALSRLSWQDFEHLLGEHYRAQGYRVERHAAAAAVGGAVDLRLRRRDENVIVQCRYWDATEVPGSEVTELLGAMLNEAATGGIVVTRGVFSRDAQSIGRRQPRLQLLDGDALRALLHLPGHLDTAAPVAEKVARQAAPARKRGKKQAIGGSRTLPFVVGAFVVVMLAVFAWKVMSDHNGDDTRSAGPAAASSAPAGGAATLPATAPAVLPPLSGRSGIVSRSASIERDPPVASRELAERERLRKLDEDARREKTRHDDAMKVMEHNTREVGEH